MRPLPSEMPTNLTLLPADPAVCGSHPRATNVQAMLSSMPLQVATLGHAHPLRVLLPPRRARTPPGQTAAAVALPAPHAGHKAAPSAWPRTPATHSAPPGPARSLTPTGPAPAR